MRFLFALQCGNFAGTERITLHLIEGLKQRGHHCEVASLEPMQGLEPHLAAHGLRWHDFDFRRGYGLPALVGLRRAISELRPDVFVQVGQRPVTTVAAALSGVPRRIYQCLHHHTYTHPEWMWRANYRVVTRVFDAVTFLTRWNADEAIAIHPPLRERTRVLYPPVPLGPVRTRAQRDEARAQLGLPRDRVLIGGAGRQVPVKRFDLFLAVARLLAERGADYHFALAGDGPEHERLVAQAERLNLADRITWFRWQSDVDPFYRSLDALLFTTEWEAFGMVPCEALARGVPAVCAVENGGLFEVLPGAGLTCFDTQDPGRLADAVDRIVRQELSDEVVAEARQALEERCDPKLYVERFMELIG